MNKYQITSILFLLSALLISLFLGEFVFVKNMTEGFDTLTPDQITTINANIIANPSMLNAPDVLQTLIDNPTIMDNSQVASLITTVPALMANTTISTYPSIISAKSKATTAPATTNSLLAPEPLPTVSTICYKELQNIINNSDAYPDLLSQTFAIQTKCQ